MSRYLSPAPWFKKYRLHLPAVFRQLGRIGTLPQIAETLGSVVVGVRESSVYKVCEACCVNGTDHHNLHSHRDYNPDFHFLLKIAPKIYAMPKPKYLDMAAVYRTHHARKRLAK